MANIRENDISFGEANGIRFATLSIAKSKTRQDGKGV